MLDGSRNHHLLRVDKFLLCSQSIKTRPFAFALAGTQHGDEVLDKSDH